MKERIKQILASFIFLLYQKRILENPINVCSIRETVDILLSSGKSLIRMGDGEIKLVQGKGIPNQDADIFLQEKLKYILSCEEENLLVALPNIFKDVSMFVPQSQKFWKEHLLFLRKVYNKNCKSNKVYYDAFFSRPYIMYRDRTHCRELFDTIRKIWEDVNIVFVEGEVSHNGVGNDLFENAAVIERIICPSENAYAAYDKILEACMKLSKEVLIAMSLGAAGKVLALELIRQGYRVIDVGSLDMEYDWFIQGAEKKCYVKKHYIITREENIAEGYLEYLEQIRTTIY